jgi:hypothetical protein
MEESAMFRAATRILRLGFETTTTPPGPTGDEQALTDFVAYASDSIVTGLVRLDAHRLTDLLNDTDELELVEVLSLGLDGGVAEADRVVVERTELIAVKAGNPRGSATLRHHTRQVAVTAGAGRYLMHGYIHGRPGADPMLHISRRPPMVPLTDATIVYETGHGRQVDHASTLIINRDVADWIRPARDADLVAVRRVLGVA